MSEVKMKLGENVTGRRPKGSGTKEKLVLEYIEDNLNANPTQNTRALNI